MMFRMQAKRRSRAALLASCLVASTCLVVSFTFVGSFNSTASRPTGATVGRVQVTAGESETTALVKVNEENTIIAASVIPGAVGFFFGHSVWLAGALFVAGSWVARQNNDVGVGLRGASEASLNMVNFGADMVTKYEVAGKVSDAFNDAMTKAGNRDVAKNVNEVVGGVSNTIKDFDSDVGIQDTLGTIFGTASELASKAADQVIRLNNEYKVTDQIQQSLERATRK